MTDRTRGDYLIVAESAVTDGYFAKEVLDGINKLRLGQDFTDFTITVESRQFRIHKVILASLCRAFKEEITAEDAQGHSSLIIRGIAVDVFESILNFAYTGSITFTDNNIESLWLAAMRLEAEPLIKACELYFEKNTNFSKCLKWYNLGIYFKRPNLIKSTLNFIERNFSAVAQQEEFLRLELGLLVNILKSDLLNVKSEEEVFEAVMRWIQFKGDRKKHLFEVLELVRLAALSQEFFFERVQNDENIRKSANCMQLVTGVLMHKLQRNLSCKPKWTCLRPRQLASLVEGVLFIGTSNDGNTNMAMLNIEKEKLWDVKPPPFCPKTMVASVCTDRAVYVMNFTYEVSERKYTSKLWCIESNASDWRELQGPVAEKKYSGLVELKGHLYAIGGGPGNVVERYDPVTNAWSYVAPLPVKVYFPAIVVLNGKIYVLGGTMGHAQAGTKTNKEISDAVQQYDPECNCWTNMSPLCLRKKRLLACAFNNTVYVMDGCLRNPSPSNAVYTFDVSANKWGRGPPLNKAHANPVTMTVLNECLTVVDVTRLPELEIETMAQNGSWNVYRKDLKIDAFKTIIRCFGGGLQVNSL